MTMLRPLLPLLMLIPLIAISGAVRAATPAEGAVRAATPAETVRATPIKGHAVTFVVRDCVRTGGRMVC